MNNDKKEIIEENSSIPVSAFSRVQQAKSRYFARTPQAQTDQTGGAIASRCYTARELYERYARGIPVEYLRTAYHTSDEAFPSDVELSGAQCSRREDLDEVGLSKQKRLLDIAELNYRMKQRKAAPAKEPKEAKEAKEPKEAKETKAPE